GAAVARVVASTDCIWTQCPRRVLSLDRSRQRSLALDGQRGGRFLESGNVHAGDRVVDRAMGRSRDGFARLRARVYGCVGGDCVEYVSAASLCRNLGKRSCRGGSRTAPT